MRLDNQHQIDEIEVDSEGTGIQEPVYPIHELSGPVLKSWPKAIGLFQIITGFLCCILGTCEVFILPLILYPEKPDAIKLSKDNCFGCGFFAGILMLIIGCTTFRATISKRVSSVKRFFTITVFLSVLYLAFCITLVVGYSKEWTVTSVYQNQSRYEVHIFLTILVWLGLLFTMTSIVRYSAEIMFGDIQLWRDWLDCCLPCCAGITFKRTDSLISTSSNDSRESRPI